MLPKISWKKIIKFGYGDIPSIGRKIIVSAGGRGLLLFTRMFCNSSDRALLPKWRFNRGLEDASGTDHVRCGEGDD